MILIDTSVWADHFRAADPVVGRLLQTRQASTHRLVVEELAMGHLPARARTIAMLLQLEKMPLLEVEEILAFIHEEALTGTGIGAIDAHLLAACLDRGDGLWSRDKKLVAQARRLGCAWDPDSSV